MSKKPLSIVLQLVVLAGLLALAGGLWSAREKVAAVVSEVSRGEADQGRRQRGRSGERKIPVIVQRVSEAANDEVIAAIGTARARRSVMIFPKADGIVVSLDHDAGDRIETGDTIVTLDTVKAELALKIAQKRLEEAERQLNRSELLKRRRVNSTARVEDAATSFERAKLELRQAEEALRDLRVEAPFAGIVGIPKVEVGDRVTTSTQIITLDQRDDLLVEFQVAEKYSARVKIGDPVAAITPSHQGRRFSGRIEHIDSRIDPVSRTVTVRAVLPNKEDVLRPGMSFAVELMLPGGTYPAVPELSVQWRKGESYVWLVENGTARRALVEAVRRGNARVLVDGGIKRGDLVVVEGVQRLRPGVAVSFAMPKTPGAGEKTRRGAAKDGPPASPVDPTKG